MKKFFLLSAAFLFSIVPASAEVLTSEVASSYSTVIGEWTYIRNAAEFMKFVSECQDPNVGPKKIRLACDIEYPSDSYQNRSAYYIKYFNGVFDGMGCTVKFYMKTSINDNVDASFIQELKGTTSEVCNLRFQDCYVNAVCATAAVVVNKVTATEEASIHDIYVDGGELVGSGSVTSMGGIVRQINANTQIEHCAVNNLKIIWPESTKPVGIFGDQLTTDDADVNNPYVKNCYMAGTPTNAQLVKFSCLTNYKDLHEGELTQKLKRNTNCFYSDISSSSVDNFYRLTEISSTDLKSGNNVLNDQYGWMYKKEQTPQPVELFYWKPYESKTNVAVGTYSGSQTLTGRICPVDYGRFIDATPLELEMVSGDYTSETDYVINDVIVNDIGVRNPITKINRTAINGFCAKSMKLPAHVTAIDGSDFLHKVTGKFIDNGYWHFVGNLLYLTTDDDRLLVTSVGNNEELTIDCQYCDSILSRAFTGQNNLKRLYVNTWFPIGYEGPYEPVKLLDTNIFIECPSDLTVYVKDGTSDQKIIGSDVDQGYKGDRDKWGNFYKQWADEGNRLIQYFPVTRNPAGLSTLMLGYPVKLPSDCRAWVATSIGDGELVLKRVKGDIVPALLPVLLSYENKGGIMHLTPYEGSAPSATSYEGSIFTGSIDPTGHKMTDSEKMTNFLTLSRPKDDPGNWDKVGFYKYHPEGYILPSYVAWISVQNVPQAKLAMVFDGDYELPDTDGISDIAEREAGPSAPVYNLSGQRVGSNYRGLIIKNGRKYIAK